MGMLRIKRDDEDDLRVVLILEGRIAGAWAEFLESECRQLMRDGFRVVLDLSDVFFIGRSGLAALGRLGRDGVRNVGASPLIAAMLEQEGIAPGRAARNLFVKGARPCSRS